MSDQIWAPQAEIGNPTTATICKINTSLNSAAAICLPRDYGRGWKPGVYLKVLGG